MLNLPLVSIIVSSYNYKDFIEKTLFDLNLELNKNKSSVYSAGLIIESLELLGYSLSSEIRRVKNKRIENAVNIKISENKLNKIKTKIKLSFIEYEISNHPTRFKLLKDRIYYLSTLRVVKKGKNGYLLAGNAYNYIFAAQTTQNDKDKDKIKIPCLKKIDRFYHGLVLKNISSFNKKELSDLKSISFYGNAQKKIEMKLTKNKALHIQQAWANQQ